MGFRCFGLLAAAGTGSRLGATLPKQYLPLGNRCMLVHAIEALLADSRIEQVIVVVAPGDLRAASLVARNVRVSAVGGIDRATSVLNGLAVLLPHADANDRVLVHDAARPCLTPRDLGNLIDQSINEADGGLLAMPMADTVKRGLADRVTATVPREGLWRAATPQLFPIGRLQHALVRAAAEGMAVSDEASAIEHVGGRPRLVPCSAANIKVTTGEDLELARVILASQGRLHA